MLVTIAGVSSNNSSETTSYHYMVVKNLGLCVPITDYLTWVLHVNAIVQIVVSVVGIAGAAVSLRVASLRKNRSSLNVQVSVLSVYDMVFLSAVLLLAILQEFGVYKQAAASAFHVLRALGLWGVSYTMVDITIERCLFIVRPFLAKKICGVGFTLKKSAAILSVGVLFTLPLILDLILDLSSRPTCGDGRRLTTYGVVYTLYISILFFYLIPFLCIFVANVILIHALRRFGQHRQIESVNCSSHADSSAKRLSVFVIGICAWYVVCVLAPSVLFLVRLSRAEVFRPERDITAVVSADTLIVLSTAANFLFYCLMWKNFRHTFLLVFCRRYPNRARYEGRPYSPYPSDDIHLHSP